MNFDSGAICQLKIGESGKESKNIAQTDLRNRRDATTAQSSYGNGHNAVEKCRQQKKKNAFGGIGDFGADHLALLLSFRESFSVFPGFRRRKRTQ